MIPFHDLRPIHEALAAELREAIERVLTSGWYILGPEVEALESELAAWIGVPHAVAVANGTDAIELILRAAEIGPGDEVITVSHTAVATVCAIERAGARPILVDVDHRTMTMSPAAAAAAVTPRTRAILAVHLYGHPADMRRLGELAQKHALLLIEDAAQALGGRLAERPVGTLGHAAAISFYPTKTVAALGDAGAVVCSEPQLAQRVRRLRSYGQASRDMALQRGINSRMDELQAAALRVKLIHAEEHLRARRALAARYEHALRGKLTLPSEADDVLHAYHLYVVRHARRDGLKARLSRGGVGTLVHYPVPVHRQPAYFDLGYAEGSLPETERAAAEVLSLPLYVGLEDGQAEHVAATLGEALAEGIT